MSKREIDYMAEFFDNLADAQKNLEKVLVEVMPESYLKPLGHLNKAQIEVLKAVHAVLENKITGLEEVGEEMESRVKTKTVRKEKVEVE